MENDDGLTTQTSLRDTISALVDQTEAGEPLTGVEKPVEGVQADAPPIGETAEQKLGRTAGRARDEHGKLLPGKAVRPESSPPTLTAASAPAQPKLVRPSSWKKDFEPHWEKLTTGQPLTPEESRALAEYNIQREGEARKGVSTYKTEWDNAKPVLDAVAPFLPDLQKHGIQPADMVGRLMGAHRQLSLGSEQEKLAAFQNLLPQYGIRAQLAVQDAQGNWQLLQQMSAPQQAPAQQQPAFRPEDIQKIVREQLQSERTVQSVSQFATEKDAGGNLLRPHYEAVRSDMALLLDAGKAQDLGSAYDMALRLNDELWKSTQDAKARADEAARQEAQRAAVRTARSNVSSVRSATPAASATGAKKGLRSTIEDAFDAVEGRV